MPVWENISFCVTTISSDYFQIWFHKGWFMENWGQDCFNFILPSPDPLFTFQVCLLFLKSFACR